MKERNATMEGPLSSEILARLANGRPLVDLGLPTMNGRVEIRGLIAPSVTMTAGPMPGVRQLKGNLEFRSFLWRDISFVESTLPSLRFFDGRVENCVFEKCDLHGTRAWNTKFANTSFVATSLRDSALGAVDGVQRNSFRSVKFERTDLRGTAYKAAEFVDCEFNDSKLRKVDFQSSTFERCSFSGELRDVLFYREGFRCEAFPPNEMRDVDFTKARLRDVEFRGVDLSTVRFPNDEDHFVIEDFRSTLERVLPLLSAEPDRASRDLAAYLDVALKWAAPGRGVLNRRDLVDGTSDAAVAKFMQMIHARLH